VNGSLTRIAYGGIGHGILTFYSVGEVEKESRSFGENYSLNTVASEQFSVGQRVRVKYTEKIFGPFWGRIYVLDMFPIK